MEEACQKLSTFRGIYHHSKDLDSIVDFVNIDNRKYTIFIGADKVSKQTFQYLTTVKTFTTVTVNCFEFVASYNCVRIVCTFDSFTSLAVFALMI